MPFIYYWLIGHHVDDPDNYNRIQFFFSSNEELAALVAVLIPCAIVFGLIQAVAGISTYVERKVAADIQRRVGPNKCNFGAFLGAFAELTVANGRNPKSGIGAKTMALLVWPLVPVLKLADKLFLIIAPGFLIFLADGIKLVMKEDIIPDPVDKPLFKLAPTIVLMSAFGACATLPYSDAWYVADFNIGLFYIAAITSIEVLGILMAGWASNNKWALLGGMRSAAQIVSYELPVGLAIVTGILICGTMSMQGMTYMQFGFAPGDTMTSSGWFWQWNVFHPAMFILAPIYFLAALAECNRTPFDIPEAESELVAGYHTEYTGMRFAFFFMGEYAMMCVTSAIAVTLFLGGWSTGLAPLEHVLMTKLPEFSAQGIMTAPPVFAWYGTLLHLIMFGIKTYALVLIMMWIRWTLPRFRVDQMMTLCWKKLIPMSMACMFGVALWALIRMWLEGRTGAYSAEEIAVRSQTYTNVTFWLRAVFAVGFLAWLGWFFAKPPTAEQLRQREMMAQSNMTAGTAL